jgi:hypothetical protein
MTGRSLSMLLAWAQDHGDDDAERWVLSFGGAPVGAVEIDEDGSYFGLISLPSDDADGDAGPSCWDEEPIVDGLTLEQAKRCVFDHVRHQMRLALEAAEGGAPS